jgi:hypothetical protein
MQVASNFRVFQKLSILEFSEGPSGMKGGGWRRGFECFLLEYIF